MNSAFDRWLADTDCQRTLSDVLAVMIPVVWPSLRLCVLRVLPYIPPGATTLTQRPAVRAEIVASYIASTVVGASV